jgi:hypothetical protein
MIRSYEVLLSPSFFLSVDDSNLTLSFLYPNPTSVYYISSVCGVMGLLYFVGGGDTQQVMTTPNSCHVCFEVTLELRKWVDLLQSVVLKCSLQSHGNVMLVFLSVR